MAVKEGRIVFLGTEKTARKICDENTAVLDYGKNTVYPGFMDAHTHGLMAGQRLAIEFDLSDGSSMQDYVDITKQYIDSHPGRTCYKGAGWNEYEEPTAAMLDAVCSDAPILLTSSDAHSCWLNSCALKQCGFDAQKAKEMGYDLVHVDENGNPSGRLCEAAGQKAREAFQPNLEEIKEGLLAWQEFAFSQGMTGVGECLLDMYEDGLKAYDELNREGKWKLRTYAYPTCREIVLGGRVSELGDHLLGLKQKYDSDHFRIMGYKVVLDGVVEAHTAYMEEDYADQPGYKGVLNIKDQDKLNELVLTVNKAGLPVHTHAIGDGAVRMILDAYEYSETETFNFELRNAACHLQCVRNEDFARFADYNVVAVVAPLWVPVEQPFFDNEIEYLGKDRAWNEYPIGSFVDAGATIAFHTDYPVTPNMNAPRSIYTAVKRGAPDKGPESVKNPDEGILPIAALLASTINCAYLFKVENELGNFRIGKKADATVFDKDFQDLDDLYHVDETKLVATIIDGEEVYRAKTE